MKRTTAFHRLIWAVIIGAVLFLPLGNLAAAGIQPAGCPHCQGAGAGLASGHCCCPPGAPGHCGACDQNGGVTCRCSSGNPAVVGPPAADAPAWQIFPVVPPLITIALQVFLPNIFHPPEPSHLSIHI